MPRYSLLWECGRTRVTEKIRTILADTPDEANREAQAVMRGRRDIFNSDDVFKVQAPDGSVFSTFTVDDLT